IRSCCSCWWPLGESPTNFQGFFPSIVPLGSLVPSDPCANSETFFHAWPPRCRPWLNILVPSSKVYSQNVWSKICDLEASPPSARRGRPCHCTPPDTCP